MPFTESFDALVVGSGEAGKYLAWTPASAGSRTAVVELTQPMAAVLRTRTLSEPRGFMKMLIAEGNDEILGFTVFGAEASEPLAAVQTSMIARMPYTAPRRAICAHPTTTEGLTFLLRNTPASLAR
ncbi:hypothetical protein GCM10009609_15600 [Pseudonocardia aurantiaca]